MLTVTTNSNEKIPYGKYQELMLAAFDLDDLIMSTTVYYLDRCTASAGSFCDSLIKAWPNLRVLTAKFVMQVVNEAFERYERGDTRALGHDCDRQKWMEVGKLWKGESM